MCCILIHIIRIIHNFNPPPLAPRPPPPQHKKPFPRSHEISNRVVTSLVIVTVPPVCLIYAWEQRKIKKKMMHFRYMIYMATPQHKSPCPGGHEIYNFVRTFLGYHYYILSLSDLCLGVKNDAFSLYDLYTHDPAQERLPCGHKSYNFGRPLLGHHYYKLNLSDLGP